MNGEPASTPSLTERQRQVLNLIAQDLSAKEIADRLGISFKTVEFHKALIRKRLGNVGTAYDTHRYT